MPSILIFESDLSFANELQTELVRRSCDVSIVDDATVGLQQAASARPDLILLCTELPRMNGFSVCNRLKRDPELKDIPVIIMSANASEENFQQHRNLTNKRADDYIHKPVSVHDLLSRVELLITLPGGAGANSRDLPELELGEVEDLDADELLVDEFVDDLIENASERDDASGTRHSAPAPDFGGARLSQPNELDLGAVTDTAFDALMSSPSESSASAPHTTGAYGVNGSAAPQTGSPSAAFAHAIPGAPALPNSVNPKHPSSPPSAPGSEARFGDETTRLAFVQTQAELTNAKERLAELEDELLREREKESKLEALYAELDDAKARLASGGGGRAKEVLDLREALNTKDKELLGLRDQLTSKDKELLGTKDAALKLERKTAEAEERAVELEKRLGSLERSERAAQQDREQAAKRADSYKAKQEKLTEELASSRAELDDLENARQALATQLGSVQQSVQQLEENNRQLGEQVARTQTSLAETRTERQSLEERLKNAQDTLAQSVSARDELQERLGRAESRINALESERTALSQEMDELRAKLTAAEHQLDESQLQAAEQGEQLDRYRVTAGELGGLLADAANKVRELEAK